MTFFTHFDKGDKKTEGEKKVFFLKCITKSNVIKKRFWVLVFSFTYLVLVDAMDKSLVAKTKIEKWDE